MLTFRSLCTTLLNDELIKPQLLCRPLQHALLNAAFRDESEDIHLLRLTNTMCAVHGLQIGLRVPVTVVQDDNVCRGEVDTQPTGTRGEQEDELLAVGLVVLVDGYYPVIMGGATVDTTVLCAPSQSSVLCKASSVRLDVLYPRNRQ